MAPRTVYVNINNEQDLITLLGSSIVDELGAKGYSVAGLLLAPEDDPGLRGLLDRHGIPLRHIRYRLRGFQPALHRLMWKLRKLRFYRLNRDGSTLQAKCLISYRGQYNPMKYALYGLFSKAFGFLAWAEPLIIASYRAGIRGLPRLDGPVLCLDYIHNLYHVELRKLNRDAGWRYAAYVANLDQLTNYPVHPDLADRIFVWGQFHKDLLVGRYGMDPGKIRSVGFCRSDCLAGIAPASAETLKAVYFCASMPSNDPDYDRNLRLLHEALEASSRPYVLTLKQHPGKESDMWERYRRLISSLEWKRGKVEYLASTWEKYSKVDKDSLADKDFSYRDLRRILENATHVFSSTSTTTLEAALAGARSFFVNIDGKLDGTFRFEHLKCLVEGGVVRMLVRPGEFAEVLSESPAGALGDNPVVSNVGRSSWALAEACAEIWEAAPAFSKPPAGEPART